METEKIIRELSLNEKKVLLALKKLHGKGSPGDIFKTGQFTQEVEIANASSWLQSKKLVLIENHMITVYSLGKEGKRFVEKGLPERRALQVLSQRNGILSLKDLSGFLDGDEIPVAIGWLKTNGWATIKKEQETIIENTEKGRAALSVVTAEETLLLDMSHDWTPAEAVAVLDEVTAIYPSLPKLAMDEQQLTLGGAVETGQPLPAELENAPWGDTQPNGLRTAWLLDPRAEQHRLGTPLKSRILFHNAGNSLVVVPRADVESVRGPQGA